MTSVLNVDTIADKAGTGPVALTKQQAAKVLSRLDTYTPGNSPSFNVSSSTDNGAGDMTITFTNSFSGTNEQFPAGFNGASNFVCNQVSRATVATTAFPSGSIRVELRSDAGSALDSYHGSITIHGDLA